ncbi:sigma factor-like helix-turn-helix DNA-binding protein [Nodosilinea sp. LEGE 07088]|uniref:sigma factor-like helix-turn-helix DNA-binding protein n=1 Tax=Nodosilinea sp. LEGE 07088 TaxID=2777968 RepID=UPI002413F605
MLKDSKILSIRERDVLKLRYGLADGREKTLSEIGQIFNISSERARVIEKKALGKLKNALTKASS